MKSFKLGPLQKMWVESLKAHPDRQTTDILGEGHPRDYKACCLGELHLCYHRMKHKKYPFNAFGSLTDRDHIGMLYTSHAKYGLRDEKGGLRKPYTIDGSSVPFFSLASMNDNGVSWPDIAKYIESNAENVFVHSV